MMLYTAKTNRYQEMQYRRCGNSGIQLPAISLGLWHNFGDVDDLENSRNIIRFAFDSGITHFDLANNYGPPPGSAETNFGKIIKQDLATHRDEMIISSKAGYNMWDGPYGDWGSKKYLVASLDQSLQRMGLNYVDIFYHHRPDPNTPLEETMTALDLHVGLSSEYLRRHRPDLFVKVQEAIREHAAQRRATWTQAMCARIDEAAAQLIAQGARPTYVALRQLANLNKYQAKAEPLIRELLQKWVGDFAPRD